MLWHSVHLIAECKHDAARKTDCVQYVKALCCRMRGLAGLMSVFTAQVGGSHLLRLLHAVNDVEPITWLLAGSAGSREWYCKSAPVRAMH